MMMQLTIIIYLILSFAFTAWLISTTGSVWWVVLLIFLVAAVKTDRS